jgi:diguanylate cyclase (GGDEF)-like protein
MARRTDKAQQNNVLRDSAPPGRTLDALGMTSNLASALQADALVMMVEDDPLIVELIRRSLARSGYQRFVYTTDAPEAIALMQRQRPDVVLLDVHMPRMSGIEILKRMRADAQLLHTPAIVLSGAEDTHTKLKALEIGATDFLRKPVDPIELALRLRNTLTVKAHQDFLAFFDRTTGLVNRQRFLGELERALIDADAPGRMGALLQLDLDRFRQINEVLGPATGDAVLREAGRRIRGVLQEYGGRCRQRDERPFAARFGGDEFSVLLPQVAGIESPTHVASELLRALAAPLAVGDKPLHVTASVGLALFPADGLSGDELVRNAGAALKDAKNAGRNAFRFYSKALNAQAAERLALEDELRRAQAQDELRLYYQPKFGVADGKLRGAEALIRWQHPARGMVSPGQFIPVAEDTGLIVPLGEWVLEEACRQLQAWAGAGLAPVPVAVNVSAQQFRPEFAALVRSVLAQSSQGGLLHLEITESSVMQDPKAAVALLRELEAGGLRLAMDDFGTGYSSLSYLQRLPLHELKIDRSFIMAIPPDGSRAPLVDAIIAMAHSLGLTVVAEGVETAQQLEYLRRQGCDQCQGYLFSKPLPAAEFAERYLRGAGAIRTAA